MENQNQESISQTTLSTQSCITNASDVVIDYEPDIHLTFIKIDEIQAAIDEANSQSNLNEGFGSNAR